MRRLLSSLLALLVLSVMIAPSTHASPKKQRILLQWTEADTLGQWVMTKHVGNLLDDLGQDNVQLEVITYGKATLGVSTATSMALQAPAIEALTKRGVTFHVCHHAMDLLGVKDADLLPTVTPVKGAMWYIATKYSDGWQILRP